MNRYAQNLLDIAQEISEIDPILAYDLEQNARAAAKDLSDEPGGFIDNLFKSKEKPVETSSVEAPPPPPPPAPTSSGPKEPEPTACMDKKPVGQALATLTASIGNEQKTLQSLRDLFIVAGPLVVDRRATSISKKILPVLVRTAHTTPVARSVLMPVIRRIIEASKVTLK